MINWEKCISGLLKVIESPSEEKGYKELFRYYQKNNLIYEAECLDFLINSKFKNVDNTNISKKQ